MPSGKMHADEVETSAGLVRALLAAQFPQWAALPITPLASAGTDHAIFRLGADLAVRLPRIAWALGQAEKERVWLPRLAPFLPLAVPEPLAQGQPGAGYPWPWSITRWLPGETLTADRLPDARRTAVALAHFVAALQRIDARNGPRAADHGLRGQPLITRDAATRRAIADLEGLIDTAAATRVWEDALRAPDWDRAPVWFHGDLLPGNILFSAQGRATAVIDFGGLGVGDPACDLMLAWGLFTGESRALFRETLAVDDATWARGRGHALAQALIFIPYYLNTNPDGVAQARHGLAEVLADWHKER